MFAVVSIMKFRAMVDASDYQDLIIDESSGTFEPEIKGNDSGGLDVITIVRVPSEEEAAEVSESLKEFTFGEPSRSPDIFIRDLDEIARRMQEEPQQLDEEEEDIPEISISGETARETAFRVAYRQTPQFKASQQKYNHSSAGRESHRRYSQTDQGKIARENYAKSSKGVERRRESQDRQRTQRRLFSTTDRDVADSDELITSAIESEIRDPEKFSGIEAIIAITDTLNISRVQAHEVFSNLLALGYYTEVKK